MNDERLTINAIVSSRQSEAPPTRSISVGCDEGRFISPEERASALLSRWDYEDFFVELGRKGKKK